MTQHATTRHGVILMLTAVMDVSTGLRSDPLPPDAAAWAVQSCRIVLQPGAYPPGAKIGDDYIAAWLPVEERQLRLAGQRLAVLLDAVFATP